MPFERLFIRSGGKAHGPFTIEQIGQAILSRRLTPSHEVSPDGETWFAAGTIWSEIRPEVSPPPDLDDSPRRRRRRSGDERERSADDDRRREPGGRSPAAVPPPAVSPARLPVPPLPPRPSPESPPAGLPPSGPSTSGPSPPAPTVPPEPASVARDEADPNETILELDLSDADEPADRSTARRRRRRRRRSGYERSDSQFSDRHESEGDAAVLPTYSGIAVRVSLVLYAAVLVGMAVVVTYALDPYDRVLNAVAALEMADSAEEVAQYEAELIALRTEYGPTALLLQLFFKIWIGLWGVTAVLFLIWKYGANKSLRRMGVHRLEFSPAACVGWYFVPIANLFKPYQAMNELWSASRSRLDDRERGGSSNLITVWWGMFVLGGVAIPLIVNFVEGLQRAVAPKGTTVNSLVGIPFACAYHLVLTIVFFTVITKLSNRLKRKLASLTGDADDVPIDDDRTRA